MMPAIDAYLLFFWLMFGHALADYPLQGDFLAGMKRRWHDLGAHGAWAWGLTMHATIHAGFVFAFTGAPILGIAEFASHWLIDLAKCEKKISFKQDQCLHVLCKIAWTLLIATGTVHGRG